VNLTSIQAEVAKKQYGLDVLNVNWKKILEDPNLQKELYEQFDAVTFMDTIEHYVPAKARYNTNLQKEIYTNMFTLAHKLLDPKSKVKKVFLSCLHQVKKDWNFLETISVWVINRTMSGFYPIGENGLIQYATQHFKEINRVDKTEDYRLTAILEKQHFQTNNNFVLNWRTIFNGIKWIFLDPHFVHRLIGLPLDAWMRLYGTDRRERKYDPEKRVRVSIVRLWMITLEANT
jgi:hypothetical protein